MPVTIGGMASGLNTDDIIKKLVEVEARPIIKWEEEKHLYNKRKEALKELKAHMDRLQGAARDLYGFRASYREKKAISSDSGVTDATANKNAQNGKYSIEVLELASTHKLSTDPIKKDETLPAGKFTLEVNGTSKTVKFRGGTLKSLQAEIESAASGIVSSSYVNTVEDRHILTLESLTPGKKGEIKIKGGQEFLFGLGLIKGAKDQEKEKMAVVFDSKYFITYAGPGKAKDETGSLEVGKEGKAVSIKGTLWRDYVLPVQVPVKKSTILEFNVAYKDIAEEKEAETMPYRLEIGPEEKTNIKGIELQGYNISRIRPLEKKPPKKEITDVLGIGVVSEGKEGRIEKLYPVDRKFSGKMEIPLGKDFENRSISKIIFYANDGTALFSNASIFTPVEGTGLLEPKNEIRKASDARVKVDGIEVVRDRNDGLNDLIKGLNINLHGISRGPVSINVEPDIEKATEKIRKFVEVYNKYLDFNREIIKAERSSKPGEYRKSRSKTGIFMGDMTILRLENSLKETIGSAYPSRADNPIKILPQIGVSTGAINAPWETIRMGKLVIDESKLTKTIRENPEGVEQFFGSDTDGDNRIDNGMAFRVESNLRPYVSSGKNIIASKMDMEDTNIKLADERIERHQDHLKKYEDKLRKKFSAMEKSLTGAKAQRDWLNNQLKGAEKKEEK